MKLITLTTALVAVGMLAGCTTKSIDSITMHHYFLNARDLFVIDEKTEMSHASCLTILATRINLRKILVRFGRPFTSISVTP